VVELGLTQSGSGDKNCDQEHEQDNRDQGREQQSRQLRNRSVVLKAAENTTFSNISSGSSSSLNSSSSSGGAKEISPDNPGKAGSDKGYYLLADANIFDVHHICLLDAMTNEVLWSTTTKRGLDFTYNPSRKYNG
jgi:hypothetical protein